MWWPASMSGMTIEQLRKGLGRPLWAKDRPPVNVERLTKCVRDITLRMQWISRNTRINARELMVYSIASKYLNSQQIADDVPKIDCFSCNKFWSLHLDVYLPMQHVILLLHRYSIRRLLKEDKDLADQDVKRCAKIVRVCAYVCVLKWMWCVGWHILVLLSPRWQMLTGLISFPIRAMLGIVASTPNELSSLFFGSSAKKRRKHKKKKKDKRLWDGKRYNWCYRKDLIKKSGYSFGIHFWARLYCGEGELRPIW